MARQNPPLLMRPMSFVRPMKNSAITSMNPITPARSITL